MNTPYTMELLGNLTSFVTNSPESVLALNTELSPSEVSAFCDLLASDAEIESLFINADSQALLDRSAIRSRSLRSLTARAYDRIVYPDLPEEGGYWELMFARSVIAALGPTLEQLKLARRNESVARSGSYVGPETVHTPNNDTGLLRAIYGALNRGSESGSSSPPDTEGAIIIITQTKSVIDSVWMLSPLGRIIWGMTQRICTRRWESAKI